MPPEMTDQQAVELLTLLDLYCQLPDSDPTAPDDLTIRMLANDLLQSLPSDMEPALRVLG
jgi:hypothetical protein